MKLTQGTFSFLPDLTDGRSRSQVRYAPRPNGWAGLASSTPMTRTRATSTGSMWGTPMFDLLEPPADVCRDACCRHDLPGTTTSGSTPSIRRAASSHARCPLLSIARPTSRASALSRQEDRTAGRYVTRLHSVRRHTIARGARLALSAASVCTRDGRDSRRMNSVVSTVVRAGYRSVADREIRSR